MFTENLLPFFLGKIDDVAKLWWTRVMVLVIGSGCVGIAVIIGESYDLAMMAWSVLLVGMFAPFAFGMYWKSANKSGALASIIGGIVTWMGAVWYFLPHTTMVNQGEAEKLTEEMFEAAMWDAVYIGSPPALLVSVVLMVVVTLLTVKFDPPKPLTDVDGNPLALDNRMGFMNPMKMFRD